MRHDTLGSLRAAPFITGRACVIMRRGLPWSQKLLSQDGRPHPPYTTLLSCAGLLKGRPRGDYPLLPCGSLWFLSFVLHGPSVQEASSSQRPSPWEPGRQIQAPGQVQVSASPQWPVDVPMGGNELLQLPFLVSLIWTLRFINRFEDCSASK